MSEQYLGRVKFFNEAKGFGFITPDGVTSDDKVETIFFHYSAINGEGKNTLDENDRVSYTKEKTDRGWQAENITLVDEDNQEG
jgi:cold shock protein